ncbi:MAG: hypothetical protein WCG73_00420 [Candidatus Moraniibacteriota bacterium]
MKLRFTRLFFVSFFFFSCVLTTLPSFVSAAGLIPCGRNSGTADEMAPCTICHIVIGGNRIINYGLQIMTITGVVIIVAMGIFYIVSAGNSEMMSKAKSGIKAALIGFAIMLGAWLIVFTVLRIFSAQGTIQNLVVEPGSSGFSFTCNTSRP